MIRPFHCVVAFLVLLTAVGCQPEPTAPATEQLDAAAPEGPTLHEQILVLDAHADIEIPGQLSTYVGADGRSRVEPAKLHAGGVGAVVLSAAVGPMPRNAEGYAAARARAEQEIEAVRQLAAEPANNAVIAHTSEEVRQAKTDGNVAMLLGLQNALIFGTEVDTIDAFHEAGVRIFALTHMGHNDWADSSRPLFDGDTGSYEPTEEHGGLSDLGRAAIERINQLGAVVDVSQLSTNATLQAIELSNAPVIASHSNVRALCDVSRNLSDAEIEAIGTNGGVIHLSPFRGYLYDSNDSALDTAIRAARAEAGLPEDFLYPFELYWELEDSAKPPFLSAVSDLLGPGSIDAMLDHLDYVVERIGIDHVGIGTDFNHGGGVEGFEDASGAANVTERLLARGYDNEQIAKIWGGNFLRVLEAAADAATAQ